MLVELAIPLGDQTTVVVDASFEVCEAEPSVGVGERFRPRWLELQRVEITRVLEDGRQAEASPEWLERTAALLVARSSELETLAEQTLREEFHP